MKEWTVCEVGDLEAVAETVCTKVSEQPADTAVVLALHGELGAGKTTFMQVLARQLGVTEVVTSPTFVVMKQYEATREVKALVHIDAYRIEDEDEMRPLGFTELLKARGTLICIEWAERIQNLLPKDALHLTFKHEDKSRRVTLT